jgi:sacsin
VTPGELAPFRDLLSALGCRDAFSAEQYASLLGRLAEEAGGRPLDPHQLGQALAAAAALGDLLGSSGAGATQAGAGAGAGAARQALLLPDARGVLRPAGELAYNDAPWLDDDAGAGAGMAGARERARCTGAAARELKRFQGIALAKAGCTS